MHHHHFQELLNLGVEAHFRSAFRDFYLFIREFDLVDPREMRPMESLIDEIDAQYPKPGAENEIRIDSYGIQRTKRIGKQSEATVKFDDSCWLLEALKKHSVPITLHKWRLDAVVIFEQGACQGIQLIYEINGRIVAAPTHYDSAVTNHLQKNLSHRKEHKFESDECIRSLQGYCSQWMKSLQIVTNKRTICFGKQQEPNFSIVLPSGSKVVAITGGYADVLDTVGLSFVSLPWSPSTHKHFSEEDRKFVKTVLLVHARLKRELSQGKLENSLIGLAILPKDMIFLIIAMCVPVSVNKVVPQMEYGLRAYRC